MKIDPKYVDGEPWCDEENCNHSYIQDVDCKYMCRYQSPGHLPLDDFSTPCIPALRRDRDQAIKERDDWKERTMKAEIKTWEKEDKIKALQREVCEYTKIIADDDGVIGVKVEDVAKSRGWPGLFEGGE